MNLLKQASYDQALIHGQASLRLGSTRAETFVLIATVLRKTGRFAEAKSFYERALARRPDDKQALAGLAWLLCTADAADIRDGATALRHAKRLCDLTGSRYPNYVSILACAYAEAGQFDEAIRTAQDGLATALRIGDLQSAGALEDELLLFREHKPLRVPQAVAGAQAPSLPEGVSGRKVSP